MAAAFWRVVARKAASACPPKAYEAVLAARKKIESIRKRAEFLAIAASGKKWVAPGFILQIGIAVPESPAIRYGLTASKKIGNAVTRNRAKRRLRALAAEIMPNASALHAYVLIARPATVTCGFDELRQDLLKALQRMKVWHEEK